MMLHIMPSYVVHNERKGVQQCEDKEGIGNPSVEDLKFLVRDSCEQCDPIRLTRSCTG